MDEFRLNFGLNAVSFRDLKHKIHFGLNRNGLISPKFGLSQLNSRTLIWSRFAPNSLLKEPLKPTKTKDMWMVELEIVAPSSF
jgi:hypothetical protein